MGNDAMGAMSRRNLLGMGVGAAAALGVAGCSASGQDGEEGQRVKNAAPARPKLIGDGSTAHYGKQPHQPGAPERLAAGQTPPQFVIFSWDGAGEVGNGLFPRFRKLAKDHGAAMTFFLSGLYLLPEDKKRLYLPPNNRPGASDIGYLSDAHIRETLDNVRQAWFDGHEIGTHFNGHFCGRNGVGRWTPEQWRSEIEQAVWFVRNWKSNSGLRNEPPLPFDYAKELVGGRAPCLEGQRNLIPAAKEMGFRYDASSAGGLQTWPHKTDGIWNFPLQQIPFPGRNFEALSMDYNFLANQSGSTHGDRAMHAIWGQEMRDGILDAFERAHRGNRAPLFVGDHFESWNGGTYMKAVEEAIKEICPRRGVRCVSFKQLSDWLDAQDPQVLAKLQDLPVGRAPEDGWGAYLSGTPEASAPAPAARITPVAE